MIFEGELQKLRTDLDLYFGYLNELKLGTIGAKPVAKPSMLKSLEQCEAFQVLPEAGGLDDQSYIWLQAAATCRNVRNLMAVAGSIKIGEDVKL